VAESHIPPARAVRFESFELDLRAVELRKNGSKIKLEGQPLRILSLLVEKPGQLVTREDLRKQLWPGNTIVDFEHSINAAMKRLREALGDSAETPRFIETLPRRGYRFLQPVKPVAPLSPRRWIRGYGWQAGLVALAVLLLGLLSVNAPALRDRLADMAEGRGNVSLAVLPLKNLSGDSADDYYADGVSEALITELGKIGRLQVLSFQTMSQYRHTSKQLVEIARELRVDALIEGSVVRSGNRVRITANLFQAAPERQLLSESYEFDARDVLAVHAEVARDVATRTKVRLTAQEQARLASSRRIDPEAYEAYLLARAYSARTGGGLKAEEHYERSIAKDPTYAPPYAGLAELYAAGNLGSRLRGPREARARGRQLAEKALALDASLAEAHAAVARMAQQEWDWTGAERAYRRAIEVNPSYALARIWYAMYLYAMERFDEAVVQARRAQQLDPASAAVNTWAGAAYSFAGREDEAAASWQRALELDPKFANASLAFSRSYVTRGMSQEAMALLNTALSYNPKNSFLLGALAHTFAGSGQRAQARKIVAELERRHASGEIPPPWGLIWAYAGLQDYDHAFAWLDVAYEDHRDRIVWIKVDPLLAPLRGDPRFDEIVRRMNMPTKIASSR
jgi:TolB-like protein/DNA-binding winged helix-turn-helix (wHTH) protein/Tfp pilus assembly protein PilF